jgi:carbamoyl-phosphate synthase large subunit
MRSTGEVLGLASTREEAIFKGLLAAGYSMKRDGGVLFSVRKTDKYELPDLAKKFYDMGFELYATEGNAKIISDFGMEVKVVNKIHENSEDNLLTLLDSGKIDYVISTSAKGRDPRADSVKMRRHAVERDIPCLTSLDTANAIADCLSSNYNVNNVELVDINKLRDTRAKLAFSKMQCAGNDFIVFNAIDQVVENPEGLSVRLCNRRKGIGADSLVMVSLSDKADAAMRIFNQDGSEGKMAGNAIRCVAKYLFDNNVNGIADMIKKADEHSANMTIETEAGVKELTLYMQNGKVSSVKVDMGKPEFTPANIPTRIQIPEGKEAIVNAPINVEGIDYSATVLSVGNPHCVVFSGFVDKIDVARIGPLFENHRAFPSRVNAEFVRVVGRNELKVRTWERGNGETPACGTGACAAAIAAVLNGHCPMNEDITVKVKGGELIVNYTGETVYLTGSAELVYEGLIEI